MNFIIFQHDRQAFNTIHIIYTYLIIVKRLNIIMFKGNNISNKSDLHFMDVYLLFYAPPFLLNITFTLRKIDAQ